MRPLYQIIYPPRQLGFALAALVTLVLQGAGLLSAPWKLVIVVLGLLYPVAMLWIQGHYYHRARAVQLSMMADAVLVALLVLANDHHFAAGLLFVSFVTMSTAIIAGVRGALVVCLIVVGVTGAISGKVIQTGGQLNWLEQLLTSLAMVTFLGFVAWQVYRETQSLEGARRNAETLGHQTRHQARQLSRYLSPAVARKLALDQSEVKSRRRCLTLCFIDLSGFTALMDTMPEHQMTRMVDEYLDAMATIANSHGATIDKFMGDGLMVFFGDPHTRGVREDAGACVQMALEMTSALAQLSLHWTDGGLPNQLKLRVGIHTGYCAVGNFGAEVMMDYTAIGGAVNLASRLEGAAPPGGILISGDTANLVADTFEMTPVRPRILKGFRAPIACCLVLGVRPKSLHSSTSIDKPKLTLLR